ncbi:MAG: hypothetical protein F6K10_05960 [Moorea sp. SIO2B7]|nr:hypothetical protein [Moorena sp. SIO2B7]
MNKKSDWSYPEPRTGLFGQWDKFVGPGATLTEQMISLVPAVFAALCITYYSYVSNLGWSLMQHIVAAIIAFDIVGGITTNATSSAKRWYHRSGQTAINHLGFVSIHILQIFLVSWLFRNLDIPYIIGVYLYLLFAASGILYVPLRIQRSVALLLVCGAILISEYVYSPTPGFEWFIPLLFIKLLVSHLTMEEPYM